MALPENVLIDTSAFYALASDDDIFHRRARDEYERVIDREQELWTTSYALVETIALIQNRLGFNALSDFMNQIGGIVNVFWVHSEVHTQAWEHLTANQGAGLSFVDWTLALASRILDAPVFTFDSDFANQGFVVIPR